MVLEKANRRRGEALTIKDWLEHRTGRITNQWRAEIRDREGQHGEAGEKILGHFLESLTLFLPPCFGENREAGEDVWEETTHLYGALALLRGLSAGEVIEELQLLRVVLLRLLLEDPPGKWESRPFQREILRLNRLLDHGVVQASVAYVDGFFFAQIQGSGIPGGVTAEVETEMAGQLDAFREDLGS